MLTSIFKPLLSPLYKGIIRGLEELKGVNAYLFSSDTPDSLQLGSPFTGNIKVILAAESTDGIPAQILAGMQGGTPRNVWTLNGMSYGAIPTMDLDASSAYTNTFALPALPASTVRLFESDDELNYLSLNSSGVLSITGSITTKVNGASVVSGVTSIAIAEVIALEIAPTAAMSVSNYPSSALLPTIKNYGLVVTGILNTSTFPSGTANYEFKEPYSDSHIAVDSDNPDGVELWNTGDIIDFSTTSSYELIQYGNFDNSSELVQGASYLVEFDYDVAESTRARIGATLKFSGVGHFSEVVVCVAESFFYFQNDGAAINSGTVTNISVKQTTVMQKFNDLPEDYSEELEFTPSIDPLYDPQWMQFESEVVDLASIVDSNFDGVVGGYAKDDVWYSVDMGEEVL